MTAASLREKPVRDLARLAKQHGVPGWHSMRKDQLIRALVRRAKRRADAALHATSAVSGATGRVGKVAASAVRQASRPQTGRSSRPSVQAAAVLACGTAPAAADAAARARQRPGGGEAARRIAEARERLARAKDLTTKPESGKPARQPRDRMVLMVRGPHWLHAFWEVTPRTMARAHAALGQEWHGARPTLRVLRIDSGVDASAAARVVREIEVHGGVKNWFIDIREPMRCRVELGYLASSGRFLCLVRSNTVSTPNASQSDTLDAHWGEILGDCERIYAMSGGYSPENNSTELQELFEERLRRPMGPPSSRPEMTEQGEPAGRRGQCQLEVDAELIIYGATQPDAHVTLQGEPVRVQADGTFRVRVDLPNKRQVLPIVTSTADGGRRQMVVMAVERNTKLLEPHGREAADF
jgi:hypothetical protein